MSHTSDVERSRETAITVRYWAGARAAAGTAEDVLEADAAAGELTLADVIARVLDLHPGEQMARTVGVCSVVDRPDGRSILSKVTTPRARPN
jgi:molybdopterin synthase sulfur carrier subunit